MAARLAGKVAIVTGAGTGIGEAIAHKFANEGAKVVVAGLADDPVEDVVKVIRERGCAAESFLGDLADETDAKACVELAIDSFGKLDILINNAGVFLDDQVCIVAPSALARRCHLDRIGGGRNGRADGRALWRFKRFSPCLYARGGIRTR